MCVVQGGCCLLAVQYCHNDRRIVQWLIIISLLYVDMCFGNMLYSPAECCGAGAVFSQRCVFSGHHVWGCDTSHQLWLGCQCVLHWLSSPAWKEELGGAYQRRSSLPWQVHRLTCEPVVHLQWLQVSYIQRCSCSGLFHFLRYFFFFLLFFLLFFFFFPFWGVSA